MTPAGDRTVLFPPAGTRWRVVVMPNNEEPPMPKMKTHSGTAKRFKLTGTGKIKRRRAGMNHLLERKSSRETRRLAGEVVLAKSDVREIKKLLGK
jgi:large subunit ribosomal protein L35